MEVKLTLEQVNRHELCKGAIDGLRRNADVALALGLSVRQVQRIKRRVEVRGAEGVVHGNTGREPPNKKPRDLYDRVVELARTEYSGFNFAHLADQLEEDQKIQVSDQTLARWLRPLGLGRPKRHVPKHRRRRERKASEGEMIFLDGSPHPWFGSDKPSCCLLHSNDDATGKPLWGKFLPAEDRNGSFEVAYRVFHKHGLPGTFYIDRASQFKTTRHGGSHVRQGPGAEETHFQRALRELGVGILFAHSPQAKGRVERLNASFQDRLVAELRRKGIKDCTAATCYFNRIFIPRYAKRFGHEPADPTPAWRRIPSGIDLRTILCAKSTRTVANDNTVSLDGTLYQLLPPEGRYHLVHAKIEVQQWFDATVHFWHAEHGFIKAKRVRTQPRQDAAQ